MTEPRVVFFLSDFGLRDAYVGVVEAVIAQLAPSVRVVHLAHQLDAGDVRGGALQLWSAAPYLPQGAVVLAVVDPGVGTSRRPLAIRTERALLVGPDNGLFAPWLADDPALEVAELTEPAFRLARTSRTFHGRDVFAPAAAHLALGMSPSALGRMLSPRSLAPLGVAPTDADAGEVWSFDRFGNAITTLRAAPGFGAVMAGDRRVASAEAYGLVGRGEALAIESSSGLIELAVNGGSARDVLGLVEGAPVRRVR